MRTGWEWTFFQFSVRSSTIKNILETGWNGAPPVPAGSTTMIDLTQYKRHKPTLKPNLTEIPVNNFAFNKEDVEEFNKIYHYIFNNKELKELVMTNSGGISIKKGVLRGAAVCVRKRTTAVEIILRDTDAYWYRFVIGYKKDKKEMFGRAAFSTYKQTLKAFGVDLEDLAIENGKEVKETIPSPKIALERAIPGVTYLKANHLDINSAFNAGMMKEFPVLESAIRYMYKMRKAEPAYKDVLNMTQGFMQSKMVGFKYSHISKAGYVFTNKYIEELAQKMRHSGLRILAYNTDGIWYDGGIYHDENEGTDIGQWKNDHINCKLRFKSKGAYEYVTEDGQYKPVVRGESTYESIKPRDQWEWGDIFKGEIKMFQFVEGLGVLLVEDEFGEDFNEKV